MRSVFLLLGVWSLVCAARPAARPGFVVIVNAANPATTISREALSGIFLKRNTTWPNGQAAEPVDLSPNQLPRVIFTREVLKKSVGAVEAFWQQQIFSGRDVPPPEKSSEKEVADFVRQHPLAVGYVSSETPLATGVRALEIDGVPR